MTTPLDELFEDLFSPEERAELDRDYELARLQGKLLQMVEASGLTRRQLAERMGQRSTSSIQRVLKNGPKNITMDTLLRFAAACGFRIEITAFRRNPALRAGGWPLPKPMRSANNNLFDLEQYRSGWKLRAASPPQSWAVSPAHKQTRSAG